MLVMAHPAPARDLARPVAGGVDDEAGADYFQRYYLDGRRALIA